MDSENSSQTQAVSLPANRAFVVQFQGTDAGQSAKMAGRVEHLTSGHRGRFQSWTELQRFIKQELVQLGTVPPDPPEDS